MSRRISACLLGAAFSTLIATARAQEPPASGGDAASLNAALIRRLERLEAELREVRAGREEEVRGLKSQVDRLEGEIAGLRPRPSPSPPVPRAFDFSPIAESGGADEGSSGGGSSDGDGDDGYSGGAGRGTMSTGGGGGSGSIGRGERTGSRSPAGYKISAEYKYNFAGGYFNFSDENKEFVVNLQNMLVADGTFYDRQKAPTQQVGFNIPFQRLYLYGNITKNWEFQLSEQSSFGNFNLLDMLVNVHYDDRLMLKLGRFLSPFYYQDYATFPMLVPTVSYSVVEPLSGMRQLGGMLWGKLWKNRVQYQAGIFNGIPNGYFDFDSNKDFIGSLTITPFMASDREWLQNLGFGVSTETGWQNYMLNRVQDVVLIPGAGSPRLDFQYNTSSGVTYFQYNDNVRAWGNRTRVAPHFFWYGRFSVLGEYVVQSRKLANPTAQAISVQRGYYVQASYFLTGERNTGDGTGGFPTIIPKRPFNPSRGEHGPGAWELAAQFSELDIGRGDIDRGFASPRWATRVDELQVGINWWPNKYVRLSFDWVHDQFNQPIPWPVADNSSSSMGDRRTNPIDSFNVFWTRIAFFF